MSITVTCPGCSAKLNAPDSAAGKKVKCPKPGCGTVIPVPAPMALEPDFEEAEEPKPKAKPKPVKAAVEDDDEPPRKKRPRDEDEDDDDDRPRKKKKKQKAAGLSPAVLAGIVLGGLLVLGAIGYGIYALVSKSDTASSGGGSSGGGGSRTAVPAGWVEFKSDSDGFRAYFPKTPQALPFKVPNPKLPPAKSITLYTAGLPTDEMFISLFVAQLRPGSSQADRDAYAEDFNRSWRAAVGVKEGTATWAGQTAKEFVITKPATKTRPESGIVVRQMTVGDNLYGVIIANGKGIPAPEMVNGFFDNFELLK
jgi:hypothetical protein